MLTPVRPASSSNSSTKSAAVTSKVTSGVDELEDPDVEDDAEFVDAVDDALLPPPQATNARAAKNAAQSRTMPLPPRPGTSMVPRMARVMVVLLGRRGWRW